MGVVTNKTDKFQACIDTCTKCSQACYECFDACLNKIVIDAKISPITISMSFSN